MTLLSALWPGVHVVIDIRDSRAAVDLAAGDGWNVSGMGSHDLPRREPAAAYWEFYGWFRPLVAATAAATETESVQVERALHVLDRRTMGELAQVPNWHWTDYKQCALEVQRNMGQ
jgi:hypothetical protein